MIVTVTPNPSIDRTLRIPALLEGGLVRARTASAEAAGKGVNVARILALQGHPATAVVPLSQASAPGFVALLAGSVPVATVEIRGEVRVNVSLVDDHGVVTKVNEPGPTLEADEVEQLLRRTASIAAGAAWVVGSGSLPPGAPIDFYARLAGLMPPGVRLAVDADGEALRACLAIGPAVALIKPNHRELEGLVGRPVRTLGEVRAAGEAVLSHGIGSILVSLGEDGALLVDGRGAVHAEARVADVANTVGAGDALLAGFLAAGDGPDALATAVAWSVAACRSPGTAVRPVQAADVEAVVVHPGVAASRALAS